MIAFLLLPTPSRVWGLGWKYSGPGHRAEPRSHTALTARAIPARAIPAPTFQFWPAVRGCLSCTNFEFLCLFFWPCGFGCTDKRQLHIFVLPSTGLPRSILLLSFFIPLFFLCYWSDKHGVYGLWGLARQGRGGGRLSARLGNMRVLATAHGFGGC